MQALVVGGWPMDGHFGDVAAHDGLARVEHRSNSARGSISLGRLVALATLFVVGIADWTASARATEVTIATASTAGVYYQVGRAICALLTSQEGDDAVTCEAVPTAGSIANLRALRAGKFTLGVVQSDWQFHAVKGTGPFADAGADPDLRALFSVHSEPFTLVARRDSMIQSLDDLKGSRVNIGNPGSGQRATMEVVMSAKDWSKADFKLADELPAEQQSLSLCHDRVEAIVYTVGHPNPSVSQAVDLCDAQLIAVGGPEIDKLVAEQPYYAYTTIPAGIYPRNDQPVQTFGVKATVVTSAKTEAETIYRLVKTVFEDLNQFRNKHPAFVRLDEAAMISDGLSAPLHDGAVRYYTEAGLM